LALAGIRKNSNGGIRSGSHSKRASPNWGLQLVVWGFGQSPGLLGELAIHRRRRRIHASLTWREATEQLDLARESKPGEEEDEVANTGRAASAP
jgi:hypothetical protein